MFIHLYICKRFIETSLRLRLVSTAEAFVAAFKCFSSRCEHIYSDCGSIFVKARKIFDSFARDAAANHQISWHFNPPSSPHFGGLWEAYIKSIKTH